MNWTSITYNSWLRAQSRLAFNRRLIASANLNKPEPTKKNYTLPGRSRLHRTANLLRTLKPATPPIFEGQAAYLKRHDLLLAGEERVLSYGIRKTR